MAFVNEIVSEEDIQKFGLDELMRQFNPYSWSNGRGPFVHAWTIDRERGIWLTKVKMIEEIGPSDRPEPTTKSIFIMDFQGQRVQFLMDKAGSSFKFSDSPFIVQWQLLEMDIPKTLNVPRNTVLPVFKEAMTVYGYRGAHRQVPNTLVEFKF